MSAPATPERRVGPGRLVATLGGAGAMAGALIVLVYQGTQPTILAHKARQLAEAVEEVLAAPARYDTLYVVDGALTRSAPGGAAAGERLYLGFASDGVPIGYAIETQKPGFQDVVRLIFGYDPVRDRLLGMKVLENKETPGLGDKIEKDSSFVAEFAGAAPPLVGVKPGAAGGDRSEAVDMITGATISSRTVIAAINEALERYRPMIERYEAGGGR